MSRVGMDAAIVLRNNAKPFVGMAVVLPSLARVTGRQYNCRPNQGNNAKPV
jgi:hypothetical protein